MYKEWYQKNKAKNLEDYFTLLRFSSISTDPHYRKEILECSAWLVEKMKKMGLSVELWEKPGTSPTLFAEDLRAGKDKETLLLYCHYDVQPVDPLEKWHSAPFSPEIREGKVYARGASDNKGQLFYTLLAIKSYLELNRSFDFNLKFLIEGEEESGSGLLYQILEEKKERLKADHLLIIDSGFDDLEKPAISLGCRGILCLGLTLKEADFDLHSGQLGGIAYNPNRALSELLASLYDQEGKVAIEGFYDGVVSLDKKTKEKLSFHFNKEKFTKEFGFTPRKENPLQAAWLEPTLEINGISGGYAGPGFKTVIPSVAQAKLSCRIAAGQDPQRVLQLVMDHIKQKTPQGMTLTIEILSEASGGVLSSPDEKIVQVMQKAYEKAFNKPVQMILIGGSIPVSQKLAAASGAQLVLVGTALSTDLIHAPNEHFGLDQLELGFITLTNAFDILKEQQ